MKSFRTITAPWNPGTVKTLQWSLTYMLLLWHVIKSRLINGVPYLYQLQNHFGCLRCAYWAAVMLLTERKEYDVYLSMCSYSVINWNHNGGKKWTSLARVIQRVSRNITGIMGDHPPLERETLVDTQSPDSCGMGALQPECEAKTWLNCVVSDMFYSF